MYSLAAINFVTDIDRPTDRQTDRWHYHYNSWSDCVAVWLSTSTGLCGWG